MRVIAGDLRGRSVTSPGGRGTRPTTDRVRESIFSSVYSRLPDLDGVAVLDAFAGSGALGIEALSRGASTCLFVEHDPGAARVLEGNLASLGLTSARAILARGDAFDVACRQGRAHRFGLVLLDPPYAYDVCKLRGLLDGLADNDMLQEGCVIVYEHALENKEKVANEFAHDERFDVTGQKKYGKIGVTYLKYATREE